MSSTFIQAVISLFLAVCNIGHPSAYSRGKGGEAVKSNEATVLGQACVWKLFFGRFFRECVKSGYLMVRLTVRGWSATSALTVSKCENFDPFFSMEYDSMTLNTHLSHCRGLKNAFLMLLRSLLYRYLTIL